MKCPICESNKSSRFDKIDGYQYFHCPICGSLHIAYDVVRDIDSGENIRKYNQNYWLEELEAAKDRAKSVSLVRAGEAFLYCRREVNNFLDIGSGPGYLLDELSKLYPDDRNIFHGVEMFPPQQRTNHSNYHVGSINDLYGMLFDAGVCIEVVEHLTPKMLSGIARDLAKVSRNNSLWLFNTGMPDYVINEDRGYLDPVNRGHIISYSVAAFRKLFKPYGFDITPLPGKSFALIAEYKPEDIDEMFEHRIFHPLDMNVSFLKKSGILYQAACESARGYYYYGEFISRTKWALSLEKELDRYRNSHDQCT